MKKFFLVALMVGMVGFMAQTNLSAGEDDTYTAKVVFSGVVSAKGG